MNIVISRHIILDKIPLLKKRGFTITQRQVIDVIKNPDHIDKQSDAPKVIASKAFDDAHILRVVYKVEDDIIKAITTYLAEKGRYY